MTHLVNLLSDISGIENMLDQLEKMTGYNGRGPLALGFNVCDKRALEDALRAHKASLERQRDLGQNALARAMNEQHARALADFVAGKTTT